MPKKLSHSVCFPTGDRPLPAALVESNEQEACFVVKDALPEEMAS